MLKRDDSHKQTTKKKEPARVSGRRPGTRRFRGLITVVLAVAMLLSAAPASADTDVSQNPSGVVIDLNMIPHYTDVAAKGYVWINALDVTVKLGVDAAAGSIPVDFSFNDGGAPVATRVTVNAKPYKDYEITFHLKVSHQDALDAYDPSKKEDFPTYRWAFTASDKLSSNTVYQLVQIGKVNTGDPFYADPSIKEVGDRAKQEPELTADTITPKKLSLSKVAAGKKQIKVTWKKAAAAQEITKYQIRYRAKGASKWTTKTASAKASSLTIKKLKKGKAYQVQIRAYRKITSGASQGTYYGEWSKTKTSKKVK